MTWPMRIGIVFCLLIGGAGGCIASRAHAETKPKTPPAVHLCTDPVHPHKNYITYGVTRIRDNAWAGPTGQNPYCITTNGYWTRVDTNAVPYANNVVAYPDSETGPEFTWPDLESGLPVLVTQLGKITFNVRSNCRGPGNWLVDLDSYFRPQAAWTSHGTFELVIANCWSGASPGGRPVQIHHIWYTFRHWITGDCTLFCWPIAVFRQVHQTKSAAVMVGRFTYWMRKHHVMPNGARWYQDGGYGPEIWSGGKGLQFWNRVTGLDPVITKLGG